MEAIVQAFIAFDSHGIERPYGLSIDEMKKEILHFRS